MTDRVPRFFDRAIVLVLALAGLALVGPGSALAVPISQSDIPDARYTNTASGGITNDLNSTKGQVTNQPVTGVGVDGSGAGLYGPTEFHASTTNHYNIPSVSASAWANNGAYSDSQSALVYFVAFSGADGGIQVGFHAAGSVDSTGGRAVLQLSLDDVYAGGAYVFPPVTLDITGGSQLLSLDTTLALTANTLYRVIMNTQAFSQGHGGAAAASLDPFFAAPAGYTVLTSADIGNAPLVATPIPAALPLFASALGVLGLVGRRKKMAAARPA